MKKSICEYCNKEFKNGQSLGGHKINCKSNPKYEELLNSKIINGKKQKGKTLSQETKDKISISRIKYLKENPDKVPYLLNHSSIISYPEQTMVKYLNEYNIKGWIHQMQFSIYQLDFAFPEYKLCVEIDGSTHQQDKVKVIDNRRDKYLKEHGWNTIRISAKQIKNNVYDCINIILNNLKYKLIEIPEDFLTKQYYNELKKLEKNKILLLKTENNKTKIINKIKIITESNINFNKIGWVNEVSVLLNISHTSVSRFMKKNMPVFYNKCYRR